MIKIRYLLLIPLILCLNGITVLYLKNKNSQNLAISFDVINDSGSLQKTSLKKQIQDENFVDKYDRENIKSKSNLLSDSHNLPVQNNEQIRHSRRQMLDIQETRSSKQLSRSWLNL